MIDPFDPTARWMRQLGELRTRAARLRRRAAAPADAIADAALDTCDALLQELAGALRERERLRADLAAEAAVRAQLFDAMPTACLVTNARGLILDANPAAGALLNVNGRRLRDRQLLVFTEERDAFGEVLQQLAADAPPLRRTLTFRPRERRPIVLNVSVFPFSPDGAASWLWFLMRPDATAAATPPRPLASTSTGSRIQPERVQ